MSKIKRTNPLFIAFITAIILFLLNTLAVISNKFTGAENSFLLSLRTPGIMSLPIGPQWLVDFMQDVSALGSVTVVLIITFLASGFFIIKKEYLHLKVFLLSTIGGGIAELMMKFIFARPRPQIVSHLVNVDTLSYPSGHSAMSAIVYLSLAVIIFNLNIKIRSKLYFLYSAIVLILIIGFSRMYLGVHYPSDVLGGWMLGAAWSSFSAILILKFK